MTLISADNDFALMAALFVIAGAAFLAEKTRIGSHLTGAVIAILAAIVAANARIIPHAAPATPEVFNVMKSLLPDNSNWSAFGISRMEFPIVAQAALLGGHVRVGLEDNLYLERGVLATNAALVERAAIIVTQMGGRLLGPEEVRRKLKLVKRSPRGV